MTGHCLQDMVNIHSTRGIMAWANGSGMSGCLYDYGPNHGFETKQDAIDDLLHLFDESLSSDESAEMAARLLEYGAHWFHDPGEAGADYCEVFESDELPEGTP